MKAQIAISRTITALVITGLLLGVGVTPALAKKGGGGGGNPHQQTTPYLELGMCRDSASTDFLVFVYWGNQTPGGLNLDIVVTFKAGGITREFGGSVAAPVQASGAVTFHVPQFTDANGAIDWDTWTSVSAISAGAFDDTSSAVHRPRLGWGTCYLT